MASRRAFLVATISLTLLGIDVQRYANANSVLPQQKMGSLMARLPKGWKIPKNVEQPILTSDFIEPGRTSAAALITDGKRYKLVIFFDLSSHSRSFTVWEDSELKSVRGISLSDGPEYSLQAGYSKLCGTPEIKCDANGLPSFSPRRPVLLLDEDDISYAFQWLGARKGFRLLTIGD
jgi:hypothetical protein